MPRRRFFEGDYAGALKSLEKAPPEEASRREIAEEIAYCGALCAAELALAGNGDVGEARQQMLKFVKECPNNYHHFQACELVGNLLVAGGEFDKAEPYYATLAKAPGPITRFGPRWRWGGPCWPRAKRPRPARPSTRPCPATPPATWPKPSAGGQGRQGPLHGRRRPERAGHQDPRDHHRQGRRRQR